MDNPVSPIPGVTGPTDFVEDGTRRLPSPDIIKPLAQRVVTSTLPVLASRSPQAAERSTSHSSSSASSSPEVYQSPSVHSGIVTPNSRSTAASSSFTPERASTSSVSSNQSSSSSGSQTPFSLDSPLLSKPRQGSPMEELSLLPGSPAPTPSPRLPANDRSSRSPSPAGSPPRKNPPSPSINPPAAAFSFEPVERTLVGRIRLPNGKNYDVYVTLTDAEGIVHDPNWDAEGKARCMSNLQELIKEQARVLQENGQQLQEIRSIQDVRDTKNPSTIAHTEIDMDVSNPTTGSVTRQPVLLNSTTLDPSSTEQKVHSLWNEIRNTLVTNATHLSQSSLRQDDFEDEAEHAPPLVMPQQQANQLRTSKLSDIAARPEDYDADLEDDVTRPFSRSQHARSTLLSDSNYNSNRNQTRRKRRSSPREPDLVRSPGVENDSEAKETLIQEYRDLENKLHKLEERQKRQREQWARDSQASKEGKPGRVGSGAGEISLEDPD